DERGDERRRPAGHIEPAAFYRAPFAPAEDAGRGFDNLRLGPRRFVIEAHLVDGEVDRLEVLACKSRARGVDNVALQIQPTRLGAIELERPLAQRGLALALNVLENRAHRR